METPSAFCPSREWTWNCPFFWEPIGQTWPVHLTQTSYPTDGENTNCVIAVHHDYSGAAMFRDIEKLELGDEIYIENFRETLTYRVLEIQIIVPSDINRVLIRDGQDLVTLVTCHPYRHNYHRYAVFCEWVLPEA